MLLHRFVQLVQLRWYNLLCGHKATFSAPCFGTGTVTMDTIVLLFDRRLQADVQRAINRRPTTPGLVGCVVPWGHGTAGL